MRGATQPAHTLQHYCACARKRPAAGGYSLPPPLYHTTTHI